MYKVILFILVFLLNIQGFSQTLHTFSLGGGAESLHNSYLSPYNLKGTRFFDVRYSRDKINDGSKWETIWDIGFGVSSLNTDFNFADKLQKGPVNLALELIVDKKYLYKFLDVKKLSVFAGGIALLQSRYQVITFYPVDMGEKDYSYFELGGSLGVSTAAKFQLNKVNIKNTVSCLVFSTALLPNYSYDLPFSNKDINRYLVFSSIGNRFSLNNEFKVEFPLFFKSMLVNSYSISYAVNYQNSDINDIRYRSLSHIFTLGIIFETQKINVLLN